MNNILYYRPQGKVMFSQVMSCLSISTIVGGLPLDRTPPKCSPGQRSHTQIRIPGQRLVLANKIEGKFRDNAPALCRYSELVHNDSGV